MSIEVFIDDKPVMADEGWTLLQTAQAADIYVPSLCAHPDLPPQKDTPPATAIFWGTTRVLHDPGAEGKPGCGLCVVELDDRGKVPACATTVSAGMRVTTNSEELSALRRARLSEILADHPHACLTCEQREGCTREPCSMNVAVEERCCPLFGACELQAVADYVGIDPATPCYRPAGQPRITSEPLFDRDANLCIACGRCVRACNSREVGALGWVRDTRGRRWVGPLAPTPIEAGCRLCGSCVEVCPTGALLDRGIKAAGRQAALVPCRATCPAGTDVPRYLRLAAEGRFEDAAAVVAERAPLVEVLGQVCFHPCEDVCRRHEVNKAPLSICRIKREVGAASASAWTSRLPAAAQDTAKKVAVVGGGPAGLVAGFILRLLGHRVTLYEAGDHIGGMLAHGIPPFRLAREVVERETRTLSEGITVKTNTPVSRVADLCREHDAVVVATGARQSVTLGVPGEELSGVQQGLPLLARVARGENAADAFAEQPVIVIGGGNVAIDCARTALRLGAARVGAARVEFVCLEQEHEMPAFAEEIGHARAEGVHFHHGWGVEAFEGHGKLAGVRLKACTRVLDSAGRFDPQYDESKTLVLAGPAVILAIGQKADRSILPSSLDGIFLAGDLATGPRSVVEATASAREAALAADAFLGGPGVLELRLGPSDSPPSLGRVDGFATLARREPEPLAADSWRRLDALMPGLGRERAREEADRCLRCDLRLHYREPRRPPVQDARLSLSETDVARVPAQGGVVRFYDADGELLAIVGGCNMQSEVRERLGVQRVATFDFQACPMFTQRQNELLAQYMEAHGQMPPGISEDDDLDGLF